MQTVTCLLLLAVTLSAFPTMDGLDPLNFHQRRCGAVANFFDQKTEDWSANNMDTWLDNWIASHTDDIEGNEYGFVGAFGKWAIGKPDLSCRDDGSGSTCDVQYCDDQVLNDHGDDIRPAYYVLWSIQRLHEYFKGLSEAYEVSAIAASLSKESWSTNFYKPKDNGQAINALKEILTIVTTIIGIGAAAAGPVGGAVSAIAGGASAAAQIQMQARDDTFQQDAALGRILSEIVTNTLKSLIEANNDLMAGENYQDTGDIRKYITGGSFLEFGGVDKTQVIDVMNSFFLGNAINQFWRQQKILILGGGTCGDGEGIGSGPKDASVCRDGKAWYLYYWHEGNGDIFSNKQWGYVTSPPGADQLGPEKPFAGVTIEDVINSSLDSYNVAEYNYDSDTAARRVNEALRDGWRNPGSQGPSWEGTFTIPVCDVGGAVSEDWGWKEYILEEYDEDARPVWCGPICSNDWDKTTRFIKAANMENFQSPKHYCPDDAHY